MDKECCRVGGYEEKNIKDGEIQEEDDVAGRSCDSVVGETTAGSQGSSNGDDEGRSLESRRERLARGKVLLLAADAFLVY